MVRFDHWTLLRLVFPAVAAAGLSTTAANASGCSWNVVQLPSVPSAGINAVSGNSSTDIWIVGCQQNCESTLTEHFDGSQWTVVTAPNVGSSINDFDAVDARDRSDVWAVGQIDEPHSQPQPLAEHWDGSAWSVSPIQDSNLFGIFYGVAAISHDDVWAVGVESSPTWRVLAEHFDGTRWYDRFAPTIGDTPQIFAASADATNDVWAVGETFMGKRGGPLRNITLAEHWDGSKWRYVPTKSPNVRNYFETVKAFSPTDVWAAGFTATETRFGHALIEHWDGASWSIVPNPAGAGPSSIIFSLTGIAPDEVWALGQINESHDLLAERWDGTKWSKVFVGPQGGASFRAAYEATLNDVWGFGPNGFGESFAENYCTY